MPKIPEADRLKSAFLADYEAVCRRHKQMVVMVNVKQEEHLPPYSAFAVAVFGANNEHVFLQALEEMRLEDLRIVDDEEVDHHG